MILVFRLIQPSSEWVVTPDKCCSQKCAALRVQWVGVGWLSTWGDGQYSYRCIRSMMGVVWTGCGKQAVYIMRKHGVLANRAITVALMLRLCLEAVLHAADSQPDKVNAQGLEIAPEMI